MDEKRTRDLEIGSKNIAYGKQMLQEDALNLALETVKARLDLEADWKEADRRKKEREHDYEELRRAPAAITLLQQTDKYERCLQYVMGMYGERNEGVLSKESGYDCK